MQKLSLKLVFLILIFFFKSPEVINSQTKNKNELVNEIIRFEMENVNFKKDTNYIKLLNKLSFNLKYINSDSVRLLSKKAILLSREINYDKGKANAYLNKGINEIIQSPNKADNFCIDSTIAICKKIKYDSLLSVAYNAKAINNLNTNNYIDAYTNYLKALKISEKLNDTIFQTVLNTNIATLFTVFKNEKESIKYFKRSLKLAKNQKNSQNLGQIKCNLGSLYLEKGDLEKAKQLTDESIEIFKKLNFDPWLSFSYTTKGKIYLKKDSLDKALMYFKLSDTILNKIDNKIGKADLFLGFSKLYLKKKWYSSSFKYAKKGLKLSQDIKYQSSEANFHKILYELYKIRGLTKNALENLEQSNKIYDSISLKDKEIELMVLNAKEEFDKEKTEINITTNKVIKKQQSYISYILIALFIAIAFLYYVYISKNTIKNLNQQLKQKTETLEENEVRLQSINENQEKLFSIIGHDLKAPIIALKNILKLIKDGGIKPEEFMPFVPKLHNDVDAISFTLNNLIYWGKTQMKGFKIFPKQIDLKDSIDESIKFLSEFAHQKNIKIINNSTENSNVLADKNHINLIIRNLINNAIKYSNPKDEIEVKTTELPNHHEIIIKDNGVGISKETIEKLNSVESLIESSYGTNKEKGTGIGLKLCYEMVEINGGTIRVESKVNKGTSFFITFPKAEKEA
ncbi:MULTISPECIES: tetratricopeptide repeat-containing sensor histidine kinase [Cellulophaga]|uniref:tetratricopeptide repeat-containing sensor histidine kinase n=1 Tax=Cellulophaga TaxID=104264 RepID=UPI001C07E5E0|nr:MULTISPECIES: tetratricopeptide repeat-containing sensor histidine kinase [Cellulophaga]MDO6768701.1 tetratricopeptide repeat-containing sensor histidine kinase [Cellulophaga sp. 1_MG-2023]